MEYKQVSPDIVIRSSDGKRIGATDPDYRKWLDDGNSPFPPDPPEGDVLVVFLSEKSLEEY